MSFSTSPSTDLLPTKSIIVCSTGRSGSNLLCATLSNLNCVGKSQEFFLPATLDQNAVYSSAPELYRYLPKVYRAGSTPNRVFGIKLHWDHMKALTKLARTDPTLEKKTNLEILSLFFPNPRFVFIRRGDLTQQAISAAIGYQTGVFIIPKDFHGEPVNSKKKVFFNPLNIYRYKQGLQRRNQNWLKFFEQNNLPFCQVVYEDLVKDFEPTIHRVLEFCDIELSDPAVEIVQGTQKQGNQINQRWLRYYNLIPESWLAGYSQLRSTLRQTLGKGR
ncbi:Stf0 family sulfotransferase [Leptothoe sp. PORK10 BA2]|nr:Stf0 family sulfotransferase [Leptothoe sp. PORK10 BA2]